MPSRSQHGRRRAAPTSAPISRRLTAVPLSSLLNRGPRFGAAAAATGLIAVSVLSAAQAAPEQSGTAREVVPAASPASVVQPMISAEAAASLSFDRPAVSSQAAPVVVAAPPAKVEAAAAGAVQAPPVAAPAPPVETAPGLRAPMASVNVSSPFGLRVNPLTGATGEWHTGMDLTGACSTPVFAAGAGTVVEAGWSQYGGGNRIVVDHGNGLKTTYNHLASIGVSVGQVLAKGVQIAGVGTTGNSTGCHLHFEVMVNDKTVDPASFI
ncbi:M23 family metallopeptidase [Arthrobacter sp. M2012083]|uniref:M23 family metallopeptidase n=1 Tax=Arthrobacter sp. M2012083 TaxID=1197706 RepID=UPI001ED90011|nr:M23 family metallopeptidase [Arthrobacter sp. M2012083]